MPTRIALAVVAAAVLSGFGYSVVKLYEGPALPDWQTAAIGFGIPANADGTQWASILIGYDGKRCAPSALVGPNAPLPKTACGNIVALLPGEHDLEFAVQSINKTTLGASSMSNAWARTKAPVLVRKVSLEAGSMYAHQPLLEEDGWQVRVQRKCSGGQSHKRSASKPARADGSCS